MSVEINHGNLVTQHIGDIAELKSSTKQAHHRLDEHEDRFSKIEPRISELEKCQARATENITNLCNRIDGLITTIRWSVGILGASAVGLFVWLLQQKMTP